MAVLFILATLLAANTRLCLADSVAQKNRMLNRVLAADYLHEHAKKLIDRATSPLAAEIFELY